jgi:hypothetical protein
MPLYIWALLSGILKSVVGTAAKSALKQGATQALKSAAVSKLASAAGTGGAAAGKGGEAPGMLQDLSGIAKGAVEQTGLPALMKGDVGQFLERRGQPELAGLAGTRGDQKQQQDPRAAGLQPPPPDGSMRQAAAAPHSAAGRSGSPAPNIRPAPQAPIGSDGAGRPHHTRGDTSLTRGLTGWETARGIGVGLLTGGRRGVKTRLDEMRATHALAPYRAGLKEALQAPDLTDERRLELQGALAATEINRQPTFQRGRDKRISTMEVARGPNAVESLAAIHEQGRPPEQLPSPDAPEDEDQGMWRSLGTRRLRGDRAERYGAERAEEATFAKQIKKYLSANPDFKEMNWQGLDTKSQRALIRHFPDFAADQNFRITRQETQAEAERAPPWDPKATRELYTDDRVVYRQRLKDAGYSDQMIDVMLQWSARQQRGRQ